MSSARYRRRLLVNRFNLAMSLATMAFGMLFLLWILAILFMNGVAALSPALFTQMTPPPGSAGGLLNAIYGSLLIVGTATLVSTPIGILAGIYLAEYGRSGWFAEATRFINDILLSAPSIILGLFIYTIYVVNIGHFSGWAGSMALALIAIPVVVRTTENMLRLVPNSLREAAVALGAPMWKVILMVTLKAVRGGVMTGVLLAVARISGETAPLLFTALNNQFCSADMNAPMANLPVVIFQFAMSPFDDWKTLAWAAALLITLTVLASEHPRAHRFPAGRRRADRARHARRMDMSTATARAGIRVRERPAAAPKMSIRDLDFFYGKFQALKGVNFDIAERRSHGVHRAIGLRQVDAAAHAEPDVLALSAASARPGEIRVQRRQHPRRGDRPQPAARESRHGVPEADAVSDVDLRQHRVRRAPVRAAVRAATWTSASNGR